MNDSFMAGTDERETEAVPSAGAPLPSNESQRLDALRSYGVLDSAAEQSFDDIVRLASMCCEAPIALITMVDRDRQWFKARVGLEVQETPRQHSFCAHAILEPDNVLMVTDARVDPRFAFNPMVRSSPGVQFYAGAPLVAPTGLPIGTLCVADHRPRALGDIQMRMLAGLASQTMTQLELRRSLMLLESAMGSQARYVEQLERRQQELRQESQTDALTGLGNFRAFQRRLEVEFARARLTGDTLALMILDVDFFKRYNDSFGHPAGDALLRQLAMVIRGACRNEDFAARVGGEEFAVILPGSTRESAFVIAERLRRGVQGAVWKHRPVTVSIGVALADVTNDTAHMLTEQADRSLYHSKRDGRNRVTLTDHSGG